MMQTSLRSAFVTTALLFFAACSSTSNAKTTSGAAAVNAKCPVSGEDLTTEAVTTTFNGKTVGFCCNNCLKKFDGMSPGDKAAKVTGAMPMK